MVDANTPSNGGQSKGGSFKDLLSNPLVIGGALLGAYVILRKKPESKVGRTIGSVRNLARDVVDTAIDTGTGLIQDVYETGQDIWSIYDNEETPDVDSVGVEGADSSLDLGADDAETQEPDDTGVDSDTGSGMAEDTEETGADMGGFDGGTSRSSRGFDGSTMDYNMDF